MVNSFFEKLKKGMGIEGPAEAGVEEEIKKNAPKPAKVKKPQKGRQIKKLDATLPPPFKAEPIEKEVEEVEEFDETSSHLTPRSILSNSAIEEPKVEKEKPAKVPQKEKWFETEGELAADVYQTENDLVIQSAIAGVKPEDLEILMEGDVITIKGNREKPEDYNPPATLPRGPSERAYFTQECYWGPFSRKVILPVEIDPNRIEATMKEGILTIRLPKIEREKKRKIEVQT